MPQLKQSWFTCMPFGQMNKALENQLKSAFRVLTLALLFIMKFHVDIHAGGLFGFFLVILCFLIFCTMCNIDI